MTLDLDAAGLGARGFVLLVRLKGRAATAGQVLAEISRVTVTCELVK